MEKSEYIESKLNELTPEFRSSTIIGEDNKEYTFEDYIRSYVLNNMRDDFTFGDDDFVDNIDTLVLLHSHNTGIDPIEKIELPKINKDHISDAVHNYVKEKGYQKYNNCFMDYNDELFGTLETMIEEFVIPNVDDHGNITEFGVSYPFRDFIDLKIKDYLEKIEEEKASMKEAKKNALKEKYQEYLNYPTNDIDSSITTFGLYIDRLSSMMDENEYVEVAGSRVKIDRILEKEIVKCMKKYEDFRHACEAIVGSGKGTLNDFKRIAIVTNASVPEGTVIDELLNGILSNIMSRLNKEQIDSLCYEITNMNIRNTGIYNRAISMLRGIDANIVSELDSSEDIMIAYKKETLRELSEGYDNMEEFTVESSKELYEEFSKALDELIELLNRSELSDSNRLFVTKMEDYRKSMKTRYIFEDEKSSIISTYRRLKREMDKDDDVKLNDYYFGFNSVQTKVEELLEMANRIIHISKKDEELFASIENTVKELKRILTEKDNKRQQKIS